MMTLPPIVDSSETLGECEEEEAAEDMREDVVFDFATRRMKENLEDEEDVRTNSGGVCVFCSFDDYFGQEKRMTRLLNRAMELVSEKGAEDIAIANIVSETSTIMEESNVVGYPPVTKAMARRHIRGYCGGNSNIRIILLNQFNHLAQEVTEIQKHIYYQDPRVGTLHVDPKMSAERHRLLKLEFDLLKVMTAHKSNSNSREQTTSRSTPASAIVHGGF